MWRNCLGAVIDFRHFIGHLLRKPGALAGYRWREELFPSLVYRAAYDRLERVGGDADKRYLEVLKLAADEGQTAVENALEQLLATPRGAISAKDVRGVLDTWRDIEREWRERPPLEVDLSDYDALLDGEQENDGWVDAVESKRPKIDPLPKAADSARLRPCRLQTTSETGT